MKKQDKMMCKYDDHKMSIAKMSSAIESSAKMSSAKVIDAVIDDSHLKNNSVYGFFWLPVTCLNQIN